MFPTLPPEGVIRNDRTVRIEGVYTGSRRKDVKIGNFQHATTCVYMHFIDTTD